MATPGDFSFIKDEMWRETLTHDYKCITPECWEALRNHDETASFLWETHGRIWDSIRSKMYDGHSGASMALSLREMESIAKNGWDDYVLKQKRVQSENEQHQRSQSF